MRFLIAALLFVSGVITAQQLDNTKSQAQFGLTVNPDTVTVGEHFIVVARLRITKDVQFTIPTGGLTDSSAVDMVAERLITDTVVGDFRDIRIVWKLAAWRTGAVKLGLQDIMLDGSVVPLSDAQVFVKSVLPQQADGDTTAIAPKPPREVIHPFAIPWLWILVTLAALAIGYLAWRYIKRRRELQATTMAWASRQLDHIDSMKLLESGRENEYVERVSNVLRQYLAMDIDEVDISMTSTEMLKAMESMSAITVRETGDIFSSADIVKFANQSATAASAKEIMVKTRALIISIYAARHPEVGSKGESR